MKVECALWRSELATSDPHQMWVLPLGITLLSPEQPGLADELSSAVSTGRPAVLGWVLPAALVIAAGWASYSAYYQHCGTWFWQPQLDLVIAEDGFQQCIGLAAADHSFYSGSPISGPAAPDINPHTWAELKRVEDRIHDNNARAEAHPEYKSVMYLGTLTSRNPGIYESELQRLRGMVIAQEEILRSPEPRIPLRIIFVNAGDQMEFGAQAAEAIVHGQDSTVVDTVGLGISTNGTRDAIRVLDGARLPMMAMSLSSSSLSTERISYYFQIAPTNTDEAEAAASYIHNWLHATEISIYSSGDEHDRYSTDLRDQLKLALARKNVRIANDLLYRVGLSGPGKDPRVLGREACGQSVVFYTGRTPELQSFLQGMWNHCRASDHPRVIGGDDSGRFVLDNRLKDFPGLNFDYLSFGSLLVYGQNCHEASSQLTFFARYAEAFPGSCLDTLDSGAVIAYDALRVLANAVHNAGPGSDKVSVLSELEQTDRFDGVSGAISYTSNHGAPENKVVLVLHAEHDKPIELECMSGDFSSNKRAAAPPC